MTTTEKWLSETMILLECAEQGESAQTICVPCSSLAITNYYIGGSGDTNNKTCLFVESVHCDLPVANHLKSDDLVRWVKWFEQHFSDASHQHRKFKFESAALYWPNVHCSVEAPPSPLLTTTSSSSPSFYPSISIFRDMQLDSFPRIYHGLQELIFVFQEQDTSTCRPSGSILKQNNKNKLTASYTAKKRVRIVVEDNHINNNNNQRFGRRKTQRVYTNS